MLQVGERSKGRQDEGDFEGQANELAAHFRIHRMQRPGIRVQHKVRQGRVEEGPRFRQAID